MNFLLKLILLIIIKLLLEYSYISFVYKFYAYAGFNYEFILTKYLIGWIVYIFGFFILYKKSNIRLYEVFVFLYLLYVLPNISFYSLSNQDTKSFFSIILPYFIILLLITNQNIFKLNYLSKGKPFILLISFILTLIVVFHYAIVSGGHIVINFIDVYSFREEYDKIGNSGFFGYLNNWVVKIFTTLLFAWALSKNKRILMLISVLLIILLYILTGHKSNLQGLFLVPLFYFLFFKVKKIDIFILISFLFLLVISILIGFYYDMIPSLIIRRLIFIPAQLNFIYLEFFSTHEFAYWANSIMKYFIAYPYDTNLAHVIGEYIGHPKENANTGFIASGYAQAGYIGIIIYTFVAVVILNIINTIAVRIDKYIVMSIVFIPIEVLYTSSDLLTTLLTHGLLISIITLWLYDKNNYTLKFNKKRYKI